MTARADFSDKLTLFTSGDTDEDAFQNLCRIIDSERILGSARLIKGQYPCICFTEAPLASLQHGLVNSSAFSRYRPFGVIFDKKYIHDLGGRTVIYQPDGEFAALPEALRWRHVTYEPSTMPPIDFTWEREWRIKSDVLPIKPNFSRIVLPSARWANRLRNRHDEQQDFKVSAYSEIMDETIARQYCEAFPWHICLLQS